MTVISHSHFSCGGCAKYNFPPHHQLKIIRVYVRIGKMLQILFTGIKCQKKSDTFRKSILKQYMRHTVGAGFSRS